MNIECGDVVLAELENGFRFNDAIIRNLILRMDKAVTGPSPMVQNAPAERVEPAERAEPAERVKLAEQTSDTPDDGELNRTSVH